MAGAGRAPAPLRIVLLVAALAAGGLAGAGWAVYDTATNRRDWQVMTGHERELRSLRPHVEGLARLGYTAWDPRVFRTQYTLAPTVVVRFDGKLRHHLVELRPGEKLNLGGRGWEVVARSTRGRFVLLRRNEGQRR